MKVALVLLLLGGTAQAAPLEDLGNCKEQFFGKGDEPGALVRYDRDAKHRITTVTKSNHEGGVFVEKRTYDDLGRLATLVDENERVVNEYDAKTGRLVHTREYSGKNPTPARVWTDEYDAAGHLVHEVAKEGDKVAIDKTYTYDQAGRVAKMAMDGGATTETRTYDDKGHLVKNIVVVNQKSIEFTYKYDDKGRRTEQANPNGRIAYSYDCR